MTIILWLGLLVVKFDLYVILCIICIIMATLCNRAGHYIFALWFLSSFFLSSFFLYGRHME